MLIYFFATSFFVALIVMRRKNRYAEASLKKMAYYDELTGFGNKNFFYKALKERLMVYEEGQLQSVAILDLDDFRYINDHMGHTLGDTIIVESAKRLKETLGEKAVITRFGGDEFAIILPGIDSENHVSCTEYIETIIRLFREPFPIEGEEITITASIGLAKIGIDDMTVDGIVRKADAALNHVKEEGKNGYCFIDDLIEEKNMQTIHMQIAMETALKNGDFQLYLQPQVSHKDGSFQVIGAEALIRWIRDDSVVYRPDEFIPLAEENGMITQLGDWVIDEVFSLNRMLVEQGIHIKLSFNVSPKQLHGDAILRKLVELKMKNREIPMNLVMEITESSFLQNKKHAIKRLNRIKALGIGLSLDDFGTGFSSLSYLRELPLDYLKIDKSFIDDLVDNRKNLTPHILSMAKTLNLKTVSEGVETREQLQILDDKDCDYYQGYYFSKPVAFNEFLSLTKFNYNAERRQAV